MPAALSGSAVFEYLQTEQNRAEQVTAELQTSFDRLDDELRQLVTRRGDALVALAKHYLPEIDRAAIDRTFVGIRDDLLDLVARKERRLEEFDRRLQQHREQAQSLEQEILAVTEQLNTLVQKREATEARIASQLESDEEFQKLSRAAVEAEALITRNEQRVEEINAEVAEKLPSYSESRLFNYLRERRYATPQYDRTGLTRVLDRWVAGLIDYRRARRGYEFLTKTPAMVQAEVTRRREDFEELMQLVRAIEVKTNEDHGLPSILAEGERLGTQRDRLIERKAREQQGIESVTAEIEALGQSQSQFYDEAIQRFRAFLERTELAVLEQRARETREPDDDAIVSEIAWLTQEISRLRPQIDQLERKRVASQSTAGGLEFVSRRFRQSNFDAQRSYFTEGFDPAEFVARFRKGVTDKDALWEAFKRHQRFQPTWVEEQAGDVAKGLEGPGSQVLLHAMGQVVGAAMQGLLQREMSRRGHAGNRPQRPSRGPAPSPHTSTRWSRKVEAPKPRWVRTSGNKGFTSGEGF